MANHLSQEQLIGYLHQTLTDAERETIDRHLAECAACRAQLDAYTALQRHIRYGLAADLRQVRAATGKNFKAIAPHLKRARRLSMFTKRSNLILSSVVTVILLIVVGFGVYSLLSNQPQPEPDVAEKVSEQPAVVATVAVGQPVAEEEQPNEESIKQPPGPVPEDSQPAVGLNSTGAMFRANPQRTGVYNDTTEPASGELLWKFETKGDILSSPIVADDVVYFGSNDHHLYAVNSRTGQQLWRFDAGGWVMTPPAIADGVVYVGSGCAGDVICIDGPNQTNQLVALDRQTGRELWRFPTAMGVWSSPAVVEGVVYFGSYDGFLYAVNRESGQEVWRFRAENSIVSSPAVGDDILYFGSGCFQCTLFSQEKANTFLYAVDRQTGQELWRFQADGYVESTPAVVDGVVYFGSNDRTLYAVDSRSGQVKWQLKTFGRITSSPAVTHDRVYVTNHDRNLYAIDRQTGQEVWRFTTAWPLSSSPVVSAGAIYFGGTGSDVYLYAVDSQTGQERWKFKVNEPIYGSPTVASGVVYFGSEDNHLYAIR